MDTAPVIMHFIRSKLKERSNTHASVPQLRMLGFIDKHPGCSLTALSEFLGIAGASASTMIDRLVRGGHGRPRRRSLSKGVTSYCTLLRSRQRRAGQCSGCGNSKTERVHGRATRRATRKNRSVSQPLLKDAFEERLRQHWPDINGNSVTDSGSGKWRRTDIILRRTKASALGEVRSKWKKLRKVVCRKRTAHARNLRIQATLQQI